MVRVAAVEICNIVCCFFFNATATTEIYTLSLHDALPIYIILAYEPVWAIGTGETASPEQAQEMHKVIRETLDNKYGVDTANSVSILYGGSVKPNNAKEIFSKPDVDGGLIGGAALNAIDFYAIVNAF